MTPLKPIGFWSYTVGDDAAADGRLSQLRRLLANQLQMHIGRTAVHIFQDVAAIPPGTDWERQISDALAASSFFIPIITPGFLQSEWCTEELLKFEAGMERRGRVDLIFPIHYLDVDAFDTVRRWECFDPSVFTYLQTLQWIDFRPLRLRDPTSETVRDRLEPAAIGIMSALYRVDPPAEQPAAQANPPLRFGSSETTTLPAQPEPDLARWRAAIIEACVKFGGVDALVGSVRAQSLANALTNFKIPPQEEVLALIDRWAFRSGKDGVAFTVGGLYWHNNEFEGAHFVRWSDLVPSQLKQSTFGVTIDDERSIEFKSSTFRPLQVFALWKHTSQLVALLQHLAAHPDRPR